MENIKKKLLKGNQSTDIKAVEINGEIESNPVLVCEKMKKFFVESVGEINRSIVSVNQQQRSNVSRNSSESEFKFKSVTRRSIENYLNELKNKKDVDHINPKMMTDAMPIIGSLLEQIVNESLNEGDVPGVLKTATVGPVPKIPRPKQAEDYRPVNTLEKLLEVVVKDQNGSQDTGKIIPAKLQ